MTTSSYPKLNWRNIKWFILAGFIPPFYFQLFNYINYGINKMDAPSDFILWTVISIALTTTLAIIVYQEIKWLDKKLPWKKHPAWRIPAELLLTNITVISLMGIFGYFTYEAQCSFHGDLSFKTHILQEFTIGVVILTITLGFVEGNYFFKQWKQSLVLAEQLKKESYQAQLESLKNQVNPHFLFNSLNVLSNLVHKDADRAEEFIDQFATVYRYVLNIQEKMAVTLREELDFLNSYIFLQKIRFQNGFDIHMDIAAECEGHFVVPLSLQMMVENAIKHNIVNEEEPLHVDIYLHNETIVVKNKINLRTDENKSIGMGLKNLRQRYFLMAGIAPEFTKEHGYFVVNIPLIKPEKKSNNTHEDECCNHRGRKIRCRKA